MKSKIIILLELIGLGLLGGCGGGGSNAVATAPTAHLAVTLPTGTANAGSPYTFTVSALDSSNAVVTPSLGTVQKTTSDRAATLPATATLAQGTGKFSVSFGTFNSSQTITARDIAGNAISGTSGVISVILPVMVDISPTNVALSSGAPQTFTANVNPPETTNRHVTWSVLEGVTGGSITVAGVYTAPITPGTYHVVATSVANATSSATAVVIVWPGAIATSPTGDMKNARGAYTATLLANGLVLVAGGDSAPYTNSIAGINGAELYDPSTGTFALTGSMTSPRYAHTATLLPNGKVLVTGGLGNGGSGKPPPVLASAELYDPAAGTFAATGNMLAPRTNHTATLLATGKVLIVGGIGNIGITGQIPYSGHGLLTAELYDPASGLFTTVGSMSRGRYAHAATLLANGKVLITGGFISSDPAEIPFPPFTDEAELYDPVSGSFASAGSMHTGRALHTSTLLSNGKVLLTGGYGVSAHEEIYDPTTGTFSSTGSMAIRRLAHTATLLSTGQVLIAGGWTDPCYLLCGTAATTTLELFDPASGTFTPIGTMRAARTAHTATVLPNGDTLLAGGENDATAELYP